MSITTNDSSTFAVMLEEQLSSLPTITFKSNDGALASAVNSLGEALEYRLHLTKDSSEKEIVRQVFAAYQELKTNPEYASAFSTLNSISSNLGVNILQVFRTLKTKVAPEVDSLHAAITKSAQELLAKSPMAGFEQPEIANRFEVLHWDNYIDSLGGEENIYKNFSSVAGYDIHSTKASILERIATSASLRLNKLTLDTTTMEDVKRRVGERMTANQRTTYLNSLMSYVFDNHELSKLVYDAVDNAVSVNRVGTSLDQCLQVINDIQPLLIVMEKTPLDVSSELLEQIHNNLQVVQNVVTTVGYTTLCLREHYQNSLVLGNGMLNGDLVNQMKEANISEDDIAKLIYVAYTNRNLEIPADGITVSAISEYKDKINAKYEELKAAYFSKAADFKQRFITQAANQELRAYLEHTDAKLLKEGTTLKEFVGNHLSTLKSAINHIDMNEDDNLNSVLYKFVIDTRYDNESIRLAHQLLGERTVLLAEAARDISDKDLAAVTASVAATLASKFIMSEIMDID